MLIINKADSNTTFITTVSEINTVTSGSTINLFNQYTNVDYTFDLPVDSSMYPERFNSFIMPTSTFSGLTPSTYTYTIKDSTSGITETGLLKVVSDVLSVEEEVANEFVFITPANTDDDFIVYKK